MSSIDDCDPVEDGYELVRWIWFWTGQCAYSPRDVISVIFGLGSIGFWIFAQAPQIWENFVHATAESLSGVFLFVWLSGDITNLVGGILTKQLPTQIYQAIWFVFVDGVLGAQWLWYSVVKPKFYATQYHQLDQSGANGGGEGNGYRPPPINPGERLPGGLGGQGGVGNGASGNGGGVGMGAGGGGAGGVDMNGDGGVDAGDEPGVGNGNGKTSVMRMVVADERFGMVVSLVLSLSALAIVTAVSVGVASQLDLVRPAESSPIGLRGLAHHQEEDEEDSDPLGQFIGWMSAALYLFSRLPQILKNRRRQSTEGLSIVMFACAVAGNTTYALSIFIWSMSPKYLWNHLPWIVGSIGTLMFDFTIFTQFHLYKNVEGNGRDTPVLK